MNNTYDISFRHVRYNRAEDFENEANESILKMPLSLGFEDVAIAQKRNICKSRLDVDISSEVIRGVKLNLPMIAANMSTVTNSKFCNLLFKQGALGVMHRAASDEDLCIAIQEIASECSLVAGSVGVGDSQVELAKKLIKAGCNILFIDIAHGFSDSVFDMADAIKAISKNCKVVAGNTTNLQMLLEAADRGSIDAVKVGVGQGSACLTKNTAGCTEKQFSAVFKFRNACLVEGIPVISDGGIKESADFVKAIGAGANSIMAGKIFAECPESAGPIVDRDGHMKKLYAGMASEWVQNGWKGGLKPLTCAEGTVRYLDIGEPVASMLEHFGGALRSGITYGGGNDITSFQNICDFVRLK